jgi:hypothetical protein
VENKVNNEQAKNIIKETFEKSFDKKNFIKFINNVLKEIDNKNFIYNNNYIPNPFSQYIGSLERIGKYNDEDDNEIDILIVNLKKESSLDKARTMQRNFIAWYLNGSRGGKLKDAALVAFVSPDCTDWRFSLVKMDYKYEQNEKSKVKIKQEFTPAKRWSFLVGPNEASHTAQSRFIKILQDDEHKPSLEILEQAFDIEKVNREFFEKYRELFIKVKSKLDDLILSDNTLKKDFDSKNVDTVNFAKKLLGQIVFLYFLQKKGWLGVTRDKKWGEGSKKFLRELFEKKHSDYKNFFNDILEPLFYEALRIDRSHDDHYYSRFDCKIPFLNGGLFDPIQNYDWVNTEIVLPDEIFSNNRITKEGDKGDGILDVFDRYNFTVAEDEPLEKEVAIDPELLGKAYEQFNAIRSDNFDEYIKALKKGEETKFNKTYGVYYTPREIVHYMCKQSIINYLATKSSQENLKISLEDIEILVEHGQQMIQQEAVAIEKKEKIEKGLQKTTQYKSNMPNSIKDNAKKINTWLADITICDPAVGSGAFLLGIMNEIVNIRNVLNIFIAQENNCTTYEIKRHCIEQSIYGVDIDPGAVEITRLRLWLSLVVDEDDINQIKPLPNLDYKIVCGNSLLGLPDDILPDDQISKNIEEKKKQLFSTTSPSKKIDIRSEINELFKEQIKFLKSMKPEIEDISFDYHIYFSEVFHKDDGFDIVIGNPPHGADISKYEDYVESNFKFFETRKNSASLFIEKSIDLLKKEGVLAYVIPKSITFVESWEKTRNLIYKKNRLLILIDITKAFENVKLEHIVLICQKTQCVSYFYNSGDFWDRYIRINTKIEVEVADKLEILPLYTDEIKIDILNKLLENSVKLYSISKTFRGLPYQSKISEDGHPILRGKNINKYLIYREIDKVNLTISELSRLKTKQLLKPKIISQNIVAHVMNPFDRIIIMATYDSKGFLTLDTVMNTFLTDNSFPYEYILGILNSRLAEWFYYWFVYNRAIRTMHFDESYIGKLPIKKITPKNQPIANQIIEHVNKLLTLTQSSDYEINQQKQIQVVTIEQQINHLVYKLYNLTEVEINLIEGGK